MRAIILAAGIGWRLGEQGRLMPKSLLEFGGETLLARHLRLLENAGIGSVSIGIGFHAEAMRAAVADAAATIDVQCVFNPDFEQGNVVTLSTLTASLCAGGPVLLMDADVLYDARMIGRLIDSEHENCFLLDRNFEAGDEPVKLCVRDGKIVEFGKQIPAALRYDFAGESVGFFRLSERAAMSAALGTADYLRTGRHAEMYEAVLRDLLLEGDSEFGYEDVTELPWVEIDFPEDVRRARSVLLPRLQDVVGVG